MLYDYNLVESCEKFQKDNFFQHKEGIILSKEKIKSMTQANKFVRNFVAKEFFDNFTSE